MVLECAMRLGVRVTRYSCIKDEGGPLGTGFHELVSNHFMLHCLIGFVVSDKEKIVLKDQVAVYTSLN